MKKYLSGQLIILICISAALADYDYGEFSGTCFAFAETEIHASPDSCSPVIALLQPGQSFEILNGTGIECVENGQSFECYQLAYKQGEDIKSGYASSAAFACTSIRFDDGLLFAAAVTGYDSEINRFSGSASVIDSSGILSFTEVDPPVDIWGAGGKFSYTVRSRIDETSGFTGVQEIVILEFIYEACGYENREIPLFWTGTDLVAGPAALSVFEAMVFHQTTEILYSPELNTLILRKVIEQWDEENEEYIETGVFEETWLWSENEFREMI